jgi:Ca2+-binding EF-hand superfamily protein
MTIKAILNTLTITAILAAAQTVSAQPPERPQGQQAQRPQGGPTDFIERIKGFDQNNDGKITKSEMPERMQAMIERLDTNKDGAIDNKELDALKDRFAQGGQQPQGQRPQGQQGQRPQGQQGQRPQGQQGQRPQGQQGQRPQFNPADMIKRIKESDKNNDGKITKDELPEQMQRMFPRIDTNQDGAIDREELAVMVKRMAERGQGGQRPDGQRPDGQRPDGQRPDGQRPDGQRPDGQRPDGQRPDGQGRGLPPLPVLQALDANHDGEISSDEIANAVKALKSLDKDGNGKLTMDELMPARGQRPGGQPGPGGRPDGFRPDGNGRPPAAGQGLDRPTRPTRPTRPE